MTTTTEPLNDNLAALRAARATLAARGIDDQIDSYLLGALSNHVDAATWEQCIGTALRCVEDSRLRVEQIISERAGVETVEEYWKSIHDDRAVWRVARKPHHCGECRDDVINKGDRYFDSGEVIGAQWATAKVCESCARKPLGWQRSEPASAEDR